jgi:hypothetical protein
VPDCLLYFHPCNCCKPSGLAVHIFKESLALLCISSLVATVALYTATVQKCWCYQCRRSRPEVVSAVAGYVVRPEHHSTILLLPFTLALFGKCENALVVCCYSFYAGHILYGT